jgi:hypothetical protein
MKKIVLMLSLTASLAGMSPVAHADLNSFLMSVNNQALSDIRNFNDRLSRQFGIPVPDVDMIVRSVPNPADAFMVLQLGQMAHMEPQLVLRQYQRSQGQGWGRLAQDLGIRPGSPEFHALKRGDLSFSGGGRGIERGENFAGEDEGGRGRGHGHGNDHGQGHGNGRGHGRD